MNGMENTVTQKRLHFPLKRDTYHFKDKIWNVFSEQYCISEFVTGNEI